MLWVLFVTLEQRVCHPQESTVGTGRSSYRQATQAITDIVVLYRTRTTVSERGSREHIDEGRAFRLDSLFNLWVMLNVHEALKASSTLGSTVKYRCTCSQIYVHEEPSTIYRRLFSGISTASAWCRLRSYWDRGHASIRKQLEHQLAKPTIGWILVIACVPEQVYFDVWQFHGRR